MGLSIAILLMPSLTKVKVGSIVELQTNPIHTNNNNIKLETFSNTPTLKIVNMPTEIPIESFRMPLQSFRLPLNFFLNLFVCHCHIGGDLIFDGYCKLLLKR